MMPSRHTRTILHARNHRSESTSVFTPGWYIGAWIFLIGLLIALVILLLHQKFFHIERIHVQGTQVLHEYDIAKTVQDILAHDVGYVIPLDTWVTLPKKKIIYELKQKFERIQDIKIHIENTHDVVITVVEWKPAFLWCYGIQTTDQKSCFYMDTQGKVFSRAPFFSTGVYPMFMNMVDELPKELQTQQVHIDESLLTVLLDVYHMFGRQSHEVEMIHFGEQHDVIFTMTQLWGQRVHHVQILLNTTTPQDIIEHNIELLAQHELFAEQFREKPLDLEYIDLRFEGKLLFKFKQQDEQV